MLLGMCVFWLNPSLEEDAWIRSLEDGLVISVQVKKMSSRLADQLLIVFRKDMRIVTTTDRAADAATIFDLTLDTPWVQQKHSSL